MKNSKSIFQNLFVLELANNHLGSLVRGKKIISEYGQVVRFNKIRAAIKLQFRDVDNFIHDSYKNMDERYIKKILFDLFEDIPLYFSSIFFNSL